MRCVQLISLTGWKPNPIPQKYSSGHVRDTWRHPPSGYVPRGPRLPLFRVDVVSLLGIGCLTRYVLMILNRLNCLVGQYYYFPTLQKKVLKLKPVFPEGRVATVQTVSCCTSLR